MKITNNRIIFAWLFVLTILYFFWPMMESETLRHQDYILDCKFKDLKHFVLRQYSVDEENKEWDRSGRIHRKKRKPLWTSNPIADKAESDRCRDLKLYHENNDPLAGTMQPDFNWRRK